MNQTTNILLGIKQPRLKKPRVDRYPVSWHRHNGRAWTGDGVKPRQTRQLRRLAERQAAT